MRPLPIAPLNPAGRPLSGSGLTRSVSAGQSVALFLAEELESDRRAVLQGGTGNGHHAGKQGEDHLVRDEEIVPAATDVASRGDSRGAGLGVTPHAIDYRRLERWWPPELEPEVTRKPRGGHDIHLFAHPH
jgi:hypothetical protein